jgi:hypothetical protein
MFRVIKKFRAYSQNEALVFEINLNSWKFQYFWQGWLT